MSTSLVYLTVFGAPLFVALLLYINWQKRNNQIAEQKWQDSKDAGMTEPASLHPLIDPNLCLGCATCVSACPEGKILGIKNRKAKLVSPSSCIGHGACREACPTDAISLVFGTETRGIEIPLVNESFETNVKGIFIAGELGGMGLIKNAIAQGKKAVGAIANEIDKSSKAELDLVIVGAGPAGLSSALAAKEKKLNFVLLEQDTVGGTIAHYPRGKIVMTQPAELPLVGKFQFREASKESLVDFWESVLKKVNLNIKTEQRVDAIEKIEKGFCVKTGKSQFTSKSILLTMGRRGTPRKLGVPGEESPKVMYRLTDPEQYTNKKVLVVGGGDSALEAALAISEQPGAEAILSYRNDAFSRAKPKNRQKVEEYSATGNKLKVMLKSNVVSISDNTVKINTGAEEEDFENDYVIVCAGGILPTPFLKKIGINVEEKFGTL